jgi:hypothetical protein
VAATCPEPSPICPDLEDSDSLDLSECDAAAAELSEQSAELDEDIDYLKYLIGTMEDRFKLFFGEVTFMRLADGPAGRGCKSAQPVGYAQIVADLDLSNSPYTEWAREIESTISAALK